MNSATDSLAAFVSGALSPLEFEQRLSSEASLESLLSEHAAPRYFQSGTNLYHYLIGLDYTAPGDLLDAQHVVSEVLATLGISFTASPVISKRNALLLSAQPGWLSADTKYLDSLCAEAPKGISDLKLKAWLKQRILEVFRCVGRPPRWIQSPAWPIGPNGPLVFLGQLSVPNYFHDEAAAYVFHDPVSGSYETIVQVA
jgi:hypothetical protein